jgi:hypothetical protein
MIRGWLEQIELLPKNTHPTHPYHLFLRGTRPSHTLATSGNSEAFNMAVSTGFRLQPHV